MDTHVQVQHAVIAATRTTPTHSQSPTGTRLVVSAFGASSEPRNTQHSVKQSLQHPTEQPVKACM